MIGIIIIIVLLALANVLAYATKEGGYDNDTVNDIIYPITLVLLCVLIYLVGIDNGSQKSSKKPITPTVTVVCKDNICDTTYNYNQNK